MAEPAASHLPTFAKLKKNCASSAEGLPHYRLALLGDSATQHLATALRGCGVEHRLALDLYESDYDQVRAEVLDPASGLYAFCPDAVLLYLCTEKLYARFAALPEDGRTGFAEAVFAEIEGYWSAISAQCEAKILQYTFVCADDDVFGDYALKVAQSFPRQLARLNLLLAEGCTAHKNVFLADLAGLQARMGRAQFYDPTFYYLARMPISLAALPAAADCVLRLIDAFLGRVRKCVVLDLDNTLWGGVIGDDGLGGIQIGELGVGRAYTDLQLWLRELRRRGVLLAVCSKNDPETAREPFEKHPDMVLRLADISLFVANWDDKVTNLRLIQKTLNIGMDSLVFLDDNPFEREAVRALLPEICVPELPEDPAHYLEYLRSLDLFATASYSEADRVRTQQYREEAGREQAQQQFANYDDYLASLDMQAFAGPFDAFHFPRIAQLTQRSNQFNLRTVRYTEDEVAALAADPAVHTLYFTLSDRFGDYGLIGVAVLRPLDAESLFVDTWLMSCRVLRRGMEEFIADKIVAAAAAAGCHRVVGEYLPTAKNKMVEHLYEQMGFTALGGGRFAAECDRYQSHKTNIKEKTV